MTWARSVQFGAHNGAFAANRRKVARLASLVLFAFAAYGMLLLDVDSSFQSLYPLSQRALEGEQQEADQTSDGDTTLRDVTVHEINDRTLQVNLNAVAKAYYSKIGSGLCLDASDQLYDYASLTKVRDVSKCARKCYRHIRLEEHRGFEYDSGAEICRCIFDNHMIPRPVKMKADSYEIDETDGVGPATKTTSDRQSYDCYQKVAAMLGNDMAGYASKDCTQDDGLVLDTILYSPVFTAAGCAKKCNRFKLMDTFLGFSVTTDDGKCKCLLMEGEMPTMRKLRSSGAIAEKSKTWQERWDDVLEKWEMQCYDKVTSGLASADPAVRLSPPGNNLFIDEFHIRNFGPNEPFVRVIGPKGTSVDDYAIVAYQGRDGAVHNRYPLTGSFDSSDSSDWGSVNVPLDSTFFRKGKSGSDGIALVNANTGECLQFFSYAHILSSVRSFVAQEGECVGVGSNPITAVEDRGTPLGYSIQLRDRADTPDDGGGTYDAFEFAGPFPKSGGTANDGQTLSLLSSGGQQVPTPTGNAWVDAHNERRAKYHFQYGADYAPVVWDDQLAAQAQTYVDWVMAQDGTCFGKLQEHGRDESSYGYENIAGSSGSSRAPSADQVLTSWAEEKESVVGSPFLAVIWRATEYIGCAQASEGTCHFSICRYVRPGNCNTYGVENDGKIALAMADTSPCGPFEPGTWSPTPSPLPIVSSSDGCTGSDPSRYNMCIDTQKTGQYTSDWTQHLFNAKAKWESVIVGDLPGVFDLSILSADYKCGSAPTSVDDMYICAKDPYIDGPYGILGSAGPTVGGYANGKYMPIAGRMRFDSADIQRMMIEGKWSEVVTHEIGHILGLGSLWDVPSWGHDLVTSSPPYYYKAGADSNACTKWREITGCEVGSAYECPPIEEDGGPSTAGGHWDEQILPTELMSGWAGNGDSPLSAITVGALEDMGYTVDYGAADPYTLDCPGTRRVRALATKEGDGEWRAADVNTRRTLSDEGTAAAIQFGQQMLDEAAAAKPEQEAALVQSNEGKGIKFIADHFVSVFYGENDTIFSVDLTNPVP